MQRPKYFLSILVLAFVLLLGGTISAQGGQQLTGTLTVLYGDSPTASQRIVMFTADDGTRYQVDIAEDALRRVGGLMSVTGKYVVVEVANAPQRGAASSATLQITNILNTGGSFDAPMLGAPMLDAPMATNYNWVNLMCRYNGDSSEDVNTTYINNFYGNNYMRLNHYFPELSRNEISVSGDVYDWRELPNDRAFYLADADRLVTLWVDCIGLFNDDIDFSSGVDGISIILNDEIDGFAWGGSVTGTLDGLNKTWPTIWMPPWAYQNMVVWTHEMGHAMGLPHSNNSDGDSDPYDNPWDMMSDAWSSTHDDPVVGVIPMYTIMYHVDKLGWMPASKKFTYAGVTTELKLDEWYYTDSNKYHIAVIPGAGSTFYTVEARERVNGDYTAYEDSLQDSGIIIHHIDEGRDEPAWLLNNGSDATPWHVGDTWKAPDGTKVKVLKDTSKGFKVRIGVFPDSPTNLVATAQGRKQIDLSWDDTVDDFGYKIEWSEDGVGGWQELATVSQNVTVYENVPLDCETTRFYRVFAMDGGGLLSDPSNIADATTTTCPTELVTNGGFEDGGWYWIPRGAVPRKVICGTGEAYAGDCAYRFDTVKGEHVKIKQKLNLNLAPFTIDGGDILVINAWFNGIPPVSRAEFRVDVIYVDDELYEKDRIKFPLHATPGGWEEIGETEFELKAEVEKIKVEVSYKGKRGTLWVDDISVGVLDNIMAFVARPMSIEGATIPLPEAPDGFRR